MKTQYRAVWVFKKDTILSWVTDPRDPRVKRVFSFFFVIFGNLALLNPLISILLLYFDPHPWTYHLQSTSTDLHPTDMPNSDNQCHKVRVSCNLEAKMQYFTIFAAARMYYFQQRPRGSKLKWLYTEFSYLRPKKSFDSVSVRCFTTHPIRFYMNLKIKGYFHTYFCLSTVLNQNQLLGYHHHHKYLLYE